MTIAQLKTGDVLRNYVKSLLWVVLLVVVYIFFAMTADIVYVDVLHINPNRTRSHAISLPFVFTPIVFIIALIGLSLTFSASLLVQGIFTVILTRKFAWPGLYCVLLGVPLVAVLSWYSYDYLTPSDFNLGINEGKDWTPYQHGMSGQRYLKTLLAQFGVSVFATAQLALSLRGMTVTCRNLFFVLCVLAAVVGIVSGISGAQIAH